LVADGAQLILVNNCNESVWPGILGGGGQPTPKDGGFHLGSGEEVVLDMPEKWSGRIWGRQGCYFDNSGKGSCSSGDCTGQLHCRGRGGVPPATVVEMTLGTSYSPLHYYDVSLVDGFNLPVSMKPVGGGVGCGVASCEVDLNICCPSSLEVKKGGKWWGVRVPAWLCNRLSIAAQGTMQTQRLANLPYLHISLRLFAQRLIVLLLMTLPASTNAGLPGMLSLSALLREEESKDSEGSQWH